MPSGAIRINVFLSSPGNLRDDRELVKRIVSEINLDTGSRSGFFINLITWETHTHPSSGKHPQDVINEQIPKDIDIFVGMMGHYFGTPTREWKSGTEEEFRIAHNSQKENGYPKIMFYFSEHVKSTREISAKQLRLVENFKTEIGKLGFLYGTYQELTEFGYTLRRHLNECASSILKGDESKAAKKEEHNFAAEIETHYPFFEILLLEDPIIAGHVHLEKATNDLNDLAQLMDKQNKQVVTFAKSMKRATQKIDANKNNFRLHRTIEGIKIISQAGSGYHVSVRGFIYEFRIKFERLISNLQRYQAVIIESEIPDLDNRLKFLTDHLRPLISNFKKLRESADFVVSSFENWPEEIESIKVTKKITQALVKDYDNLFKQSILLCETFCDEIEALREAAQPTPSLPPHPQV